MGWDKDVEKGTPAYELASSDAVTIRAVAGPGSGKTFALMRRITRLVEQDVDPKKILAITFTRNAAEDLKREIGALGVDGVENVHSRTIHSHALKILMQSDVLSRTGRIPRMIIDHEIIPAHKDLDDGTFGGIKDKKKLLASYLAAWACLQNDEVGYVKDEIQEKYEKDLQTWLIDHEGILVGEVIPIVIQFLRNNPVHREIGNYEYILVDEYQDLNKSEQEFIKLIRGDANIAIVGDDDQSIYAFKFAHPEGIREVDKLFGAYQDIPFELCRRCPQKITNMASELISKNPDRTLGELKPYSKNPDGIAEIIQWQDLDEEISGIGEIIFNELKKGIISPSDILVLTPRRKIGYKLRDLLVTNSIPVKSYFRESVITNEKVRVAYSLLNLLTYPEDKISLRFLLGCGSANYLNSQYAKLINLATDNGIQIREALDSVISGKIPDKGIKNIVRRYNEVLSDLEELSKLIIDDPENGFEQFLINSSVEEEEYSEINQIYKRILTDIEYEDLTEKEVFIEFIKEVFTQIKETIALPDSPESIDHVRIMSLHSSKGLSSKLVIMCSMIDHLIPYIPEKLARRELKRTIEEQRRLFYVAMTRCKSHDIYDGRLIISSFVSIYGLEAIRMGIKCKTNKKLNVMSTQYLNDMKKTSPKPVNGKTLL